jgi:hypothetical protein
MAFARACPDAFLLQFATFFDDANALSGSFALASLHSASVEHGSTGLTTPVKQVTTTSAVAICITRLIPCHMRHGNIINHFMSV